jgi:hypothetical protein
MNSLRTNFDLLAPQLVGPASGSRRPRRALRSPSSANSLGKSRSSYALDHQPHACSVSGMRRARCHTVAPADHGFLAAMHEVSGKIEG